MNPALSDLIDALAAAEVVDYLSAQPVPGNDPGPARSERPASDDAQQAA